jgi:hypothetical protein
MGVCCAMVCDYRDGSVRWYILKLSVGQAVLIDLCPYRRRSPPSPFRYEECMTSYTLQFVIGNLV